MAPDDLVSPCYLRASSYRLRRPVALSFQLYLLGLRGLDVGVAGMFLTLTPVFGAAGGMLVLGERLATPQLVGAVRIVGAMAALLAGQGRASAPPRE